ncbi:phage tail protein [Roseibium marinum]|uniref:Tail protein P2 I n=1 Tax=Roseibium marinum TaxID=281252 RepID=A0A2S3UNC1_9HYPH|nr:phage tail protein [Roseibium marinum]POF29080.1 tail protein P2 I [Roseibium marinum]
MRAVTDIIARPGLDDGTVRLAWTNPDSEAFAPGAFTSIRVLRRERAHPRNSDDGTVLYDGPPIAALADKDPAAPAFRYYRIFARDDAGILHDGETALATAFAAKHSGIAERLYALLPAIHQRFDTPLDAAALGVLTPAQRSALAALPPELAGSGPLRRFALALFRPFDLIRSTAEALPLMRDVDHCPPVALRALADSLGWALDETLPLARRRNDVRFAPSLLRRNGSVEGIATLIERSTGWRVDLVEGHARLLRTHRPARRSLCSLIQRDGLWRAADDLAPLLGLPEVEASGGAATPATVTGSLTGPFDFPPGGTLRLEIGSQAPFNLRLDAGDVDDITAVTAAELATVINTLAPELTARELPGGELEIATAETGPEARLRVLFTRCTPRSTDAAPAGRPVATTAGPDNATLMFYETFDPADAVTRRAAQDRLRGLPAPAPDLPFAPAPSLPVASVSTPPLPARARIRARVRRNARWLDSFALDTGPDPAARPAAMRLPDDRVLLAWLANPNTARARIEMRFAMLGDPAPARLALGSSGPWSLPPGTSLALTVARRDGATRRTGIAFAATDFADPAAVTQTELVSLLTLRLDGVTAQPRADGGVALVSDEAGGGVRLSLDLRPGVSTAASVLGLDPARASASGNDGLDLVLADATSPTLPAGRLEDPFLAPDGAGGAYLFVVNAADNRRLLATRFSAGAWAPVEQLADHAAEPAARLGSDGLVHLFFARRDPTAPGEDRWTVRRRRFDPGIPGWDAEAAITNQPPGGRAADREPAPGPETGGGFLLFLSSDRSGGRALHSLSVPLAAGPAATPSAVLSDAFNDSAPLPLSLGDGTLELIFRSDDAPAATRTPRNLPGSTLKSRREDGLGLVPHAAGALTVDPSDTARLGLRDRQTDLLTYTAQRPIGPLGLVRRPGTQAIAEPALSPSELRTRETVTAYIRRAATGAPLTAERQTRLAGVLERYKPINLRLALAVAPERTLEEVYSPFDDIGERWEDRGPVVENVGPYADASTAAAPDLRFLLTNSLTHRTADPADLASLRNRLFFLPLQ